MDMGSHAKLGSNQCEGVAYKNWFSRGKWHNARTCAGTKIQDGGHEILRRPWGHGDEFLITLVFAILNSFGIRKHLQ